MGTINIDTLILDFHTGAVIAKAGTELDTNSPVINRIFAIANDAERILQGDDPYWEDQARGFMESIKPFLTALTAWMDHEADIMPKENTHKLKIISERADPQSRRVHVRWGWGDLIGVLTLQDSGMYRVTSSEGSISFFPTQTVSKILLDSFCPDFCLNV